ncbi:MAG: hypothetical protein ACRCU0_02665 [Candidatus Rhabdochlamydia sp.]
MNINPLDSFSHVFSQGRTLYQALWYASKEGDFHRVESIIKQSKSHIKKEEIGQCFIAAARDGHTNIIDFFIASNMPIAPKDLNDSLAAALTGNYIETANILIHSRTKEALYEAFKVALSNNCVQVIEATTKHIEPGCLYESLVFLLEKNRIESEGFTSSTYYEDLIETIIRSLTPELSWEILQTALTHNCESLVMRIIKSIWPEKLLLAFT